MKKASVIVDTWTKDGINFVKHYNGTITRILSESDFSQVEKMSLLEAQHKH